MFPFPRMDSRARKAEIEGATRRHLFLMWAGMRRGVSRGMDVRAALVRGENLCKCVLC